jgi:hypothetical protein
MSARRPLDLQRIRHVPRELLRSRDLQDAVAADVELLWWHQRAVHESFGVAAGLEVALVDDTAVDVAPGVAFDCYGRDLLVPEHRVVPLPEEGGMTLLARYRTDQGPACGSRLRAGTAELVWRTTASVDIHAGVRLARLERDPDPRLLPEPRRARPLARPRVAAGETLPDGTPWQPFGREGLEVRVDTRTAGFTDTPCYFAWLNWPRLNVSPLRPIVVTLALQYVEQSTPDGFTFRIWLPQRMQALAQVRMPLAVRARQEQLSVCWLGIEPNEPVQVRLPAKGIA